MLQARERLLPRRVHPPVLPRVQRSLTSRSARSRFRAFDLNPPTPNSENALPPAGSLLLDPLPLRLPRALSATLRERNLRNLLLVLRARPSSRRIAAAAARTFRRDRGPRSNLLGTSARARDRHSVRTASSARDCHFSTCGPALRLLPGCFSAATLALLLARVLDLTCSPTGQLDGFLGSSAYRAGVEVTRMTLAHEIENAHGRNSARRLLLRRAREVDDLIFCHAARSSFCPHKLRPAPLARPA